MNRYILLMLLFFVMSLEIKAQATLKAYQKAGEQALQLQDYFAALVHFEKALMIEPDRLDIKAQYARAAQAFGALTIAERTYEELASARESIRFPLLKFHLAQVKQNLGKYEEAKEHYIQFINEKQLQTDLRQALEEARANMLECDWSLRVTADSNRRITITHLSNEINSPYSDYSPVPLGHKLYFSSLQYPKKRDNYNIERLISKIKVSESGNESTVLEKINEKFKHSGHLTFSQDGEHAYYTICDYTVGTIVLCKIYHREVLNNGDWGDSNQLPGFINVPQYTTTQPNLGILPDGREVLFFSSNMPGGKGGLDLWYSVIDQHQAWAEPINLTELNTSEHDVTPFYHSASHTLFFSTKGYNSLGGYDIYESGYEKNSWRPAQHLAYPLNSSYDDLYYYLTENGEKAYFSSNRPGALKLDEYSETCCHDIYLVDFKKVDLNALIFNAETKEPLNGAKIQLIDITDNRRRDSLDENGNAYHFPLDFGKRYLLFASKEGYFPSDTMLLTTLELATSKTFTEHLYLAPIGVDLTVLTLEADQGIPLYDVQVELLEIKSKEGILKQDPNSYEYHFPLRLDQRYKVKASKNGYLPDETEVFNTENLSSSTNFLKKLYLKRSPLLLLPIPLYFDNDEPDKRSLAKQSSKGYDLAYEEYRLTENIFVEKYTEGIKDPEQKRIAEGRIRNFFQNEVRSGFDKLTQFADLILPYLLKGDTVEMVMEGFASPRARLAYNDLLTQRRIDSVKKYLRDYGEGQYAKFLDNQQLRIRERPNGERLAPAGVSEKLNDHRNSIYSVEASRERRVVIVQFNIVEN